jgi:hypothetical protein
MLPPLPEHIGEIVGIRNTPADTSEFWGYFADGFKTDKKQCVFTADQIRAYALAAIEHYRTQVQVSDEQIDVMACAEVEKHWPLEKGPTSRQYYLGYTHGARAILALRPAPAAQVGDGDFFVLDDEAKAMIVNSHHYTPDNIRALIDQLKAFADPQKTSQDDWDNLDWRGFCNTLWRVMSGLACDIQPSTADVPEANFGNTAQATAAQCEPDNFGNFDVLQITTAYEQGFGHAFRDELSNPYPSGHKTHTAWDYGRFAGKRKGAQAGEGGV